LPYLGLIHPVLFHLSVSEYEKISLVYHCTLPSRNPTWAETAKAKDLDVRQLWWWHTLYMSPNYLHRISMNYCNKWNVPHAIHKLMIIFRPQIGFE